MALCRYHHVLQHSMGWYRFCERFPEAKKDLESKGWEVKDVFGVMKLMRR